MGTIEIFQIIFYLGLTTLFVESEPIILLKRLIGLKEEKIGYNKYYDFICKLVYCNWCSSVYISFILSYTSSQNIFHSFQIMAITSFIMWVIEKRKF